LALFKKEDLNRGKIPRYRFDFDYREIENEKRTKENTGEKFKKMIETETRKLQIYLIGLRNIKDKTKKVLTHGEAWLDLTINGKMDKDHEKKMLSTKRELKQSGTDINMLLEMEVDIPKNRSLVPYIDIRVYHNEKFYGFNSINLYKLLPKLKEKEGQGAAANYDSEETILDV
jgi:hypothetical protein